MSSSRPQKHLLVVFFGPPLWIVGFAGFYGGIEWDEWLLVVVCLFVCLLACLLVCLFAWLVVCLFVCLLACLLVCLFVCLVGWLVVCLFVCLFVVVVGCWLLVVVLVVGVVVVLLLLLLLFRSISVELLQSALVQKAGHLRRVDSQLGAPIVRLCRIVRLSWGAPLVSEHSQNCHTWSHPI